MLRGHRAGGRRGGLVGSHRHQRETAGVFAPIDYSFPSDGVLATGAMNEAMWLLADLDLAQIARVRAEGQVYNYRDWARQFDSDVIPVTVPEPGWLVPAMVTSVVR
ncbi:MAG: hypothetical protein R3A10_21330 [Caldilineaceae bacterium]